MFPTFDVFCQVMDQCTENFECIVIHNNAKSNRLEDQVFWYKADPHSEFRIGASEFWTLSNEICRGGGGEDGDDNEMFDAGCIKQKRGPLISVRKTDGWCA